MGMQEESEAVNRLINSVTDLIRDGKNHEALQLLLRGQGLYGERADLLLGFGTVCHSLKEYDKGLLFLIRANELDSKNPDIVVNLALCAKRLNRLNEYSALIVKTLGLFPSDPDLLALSMELPEESRKQSATPPQLTVAKDTALPPALYADFLKAQQLRKQNKPVQAIEILNKMFSTEYFMDANLISETIVSLLLVKEYAQVKKLFGIIVKIDTALKVIDPSLVAQIMAVMPEIVPASFVNVLKNSDKEWVQNFNKTGVIPEIPALIGSIVPEMSGGSAFYSLACNCPLCGAENFFSLARTLLIKRRLICPECLAPISIDYFMIKEFIAKNYPDFLDESIYRWDKRLYSLQRKAGGWRAEGERSGQLPVAILNLANDYTHLLNQVITTRIFKCRQSSL